MQLAVGQNVTIVMGQGTQIPDGTQLEATVLNSGPGGLRFRAAERGLFFVRWSHIRKIIQHKAPPDTGDSTPASTASSDEKIPAPARSTASESEAFSLPADASAVGDRPVAAAPTQGRSYATDTAEASRPAAFAPPQWQARPYSSNDNDPIPHDGRWFFSIDYYGVGNAATGLRNGSQLLVNSLPAGSAASYSATGGWGLTAGYLRPASDVVDWGGSLSYIAGPQYAESFSPGTSGASFGDSTSGDISYLRFLLEAHAHWAIQENMAAHFHLGVGVAQGWQQETDQLYCNSPSTLCQQLGILPVGALRVANYSVTGTGFAWEVGPGLSYKNWELLIEAAGLPKLAASENLDMATLSYWTTFKASLRYSF